MMNHFYILAFDSTSHSIRSEQLAASWPLGFTVVPLPTEIAADCGLALKFKDEAIEDVFAFCKSLSLPCRLYRQSQDKINGIRETELLDQSLYFSNNLENAPKRINGGHYDIP